MKRTYRDGDTVRLLITVRMGGWKTDCTPGYLVNVDVVNAEGTLVVSRSGPSGKATISARSPSRGPLACPGVRNSGKVTPRPSKPNATRS